jgi:hypothetical protein
LTAGSSDFEEFGYEATKNRFNELESLDISAYSKSNAPQTLRMRGFNEDTGFKLW